MLKNNTSRVINPLDLGYSSNELKQPLSPNTAERMFGKIERPISPRSLARFSASSATSSIGTGSGSSFTNTAACSEAKKMYSH